MKICEYGCGREAKYQFKNGKWCCSKYYSQCPTKQKEKSIQTKKHWEDPNSGHNSILYRENLSNIMKEVHKDPDSVYNSISYRENLSNRKRKEWKDPNSGFNSISCKEKRSNKMKEKWEDPNSIFNSDLCRNKKKLSIEQIKERYPFFSRIEEIRYNTDLSGEKEIQVHCKNHNCPNSKEKDGWFTPSSSQLTERFRALEKPHGMIENNFYCSQYCKDTCPLYDLRFDPFRNTGLPYTYQEKQDFINKVLERQKEECVCNHNFCEKCYSTKDLHVHHEKPVKTHPHLALDPDNGIVLCKKCHYEIGHKIGTECSTGALANKILPGCKLGGY